jgi:hypothetical protein
VQFGTGQIGEAVQLLLGSGTNASVGNTKARANARSMALVKHGRTTGCRYRFLARPNNTTEQQ